MLEELHARCLIGVSCGTERLEERGNILRLHGIATTFVGVLHLGRLAFLKLPFRILQSTELAIGKPSQSCQCSDKNNLLDVLENNHELV